MSALEQYDLETEVAPRVTLRVVSPNPREWASGPPLALRRARRARTLHRRRVGSALAVLALAGLVLAWPGRALGGSTATGLSTDVATGASLAPGVLYVVQPGDSVDSIARLVNPTSPASARASLVSELGSDTVVAGEHVLIP